MDTQTSQPVGAQAGIACDTSEESLHRGETITTPVSPGTVRDTQLMRCTTCLLASRKNRYEAARLPDLVDGRRWWGILDHRTSSWLVTNDKIQRYSWRHSAVSGINRRQNLDALSPDGGRA